MKSLVQYINEVSDEMLQRAIDKCRDQNTVLMKRRAKELEKWLNDPRRKEIMTLQGNDAHVAKFNQAKKKYFDTGVEAFKNNDKGTAAENIYKFFIELTNLIQNKKFGKIKVDDVSGKHIDGQRWSESWGYFRRGSWCDYCTDDGIDFNKFSRKRDGRLYNDTFAITSFVSIDLPEQDLMNHDYKQCFLIHTYVQFNENATMYMYTDIPWECIPPELEGDLENMLKYFKEIGVGVQSWKSIDTMIGKQNLADKVRIETVVANNFNINLEDVSYGKALEKFCEVLQEIDKNCTIEFGNFKSSSEPSNHWVGGAQTYRSKSSQSAKLTFFGNEHILSIEGSGDMHTKSVSISFDDIKGAISAAREYYDVGTWIGGQYKIKQAVFDILEKDRKD